MDIQFRADGMPLDKTMRVALAQRGGDAPHEVLRVLALEEKLLAAGNPSCPFDLLAGFAQDSDVDVRLAVASNPSCPSGTLAGLANDPSDEVRLVIALQPFFSAEGLATLALDQSGYWKREREQRADTRMTLAIHPSCPPDVFSMLARDSDDGVREAVAANPSCPRKILAKLATIQSAPYAGLLSIILPAPAKSLRIWRAI